MKLSSMRPQAGAHQRPPRGLNRECIGRRTAALACRARPDADADAAPCTTSRRAAVLAPLALAAAAIVMQPPRAAIADDDFIDAAPDAAIAADAAAADAAVDAAAAAEPPPAAALSRANRAGLAHFSDDTLAYAFDYPTATASGAPLSLLVSRAPEKYSSAAPLTADARQRIVAELLDLRRFVTVSMTVGPAAGVLKDKPEAEWKPREVALTVLIDRSTARLSSGQRTALADVQDVRVERRGAGGGTPVWVYEHIAQGSPTLSSATTETFRHALAATAVRPGLSGEPYLYTLNLSCPEALWDDLRPQFEAAVASFELTAPTRSYTAPDKDPWRFF